MWLQIHDPPIESARSGPVHRCQCLVIVPISDLVAASFFPEFWWTACYFFFLFLFSSDLYFEMPHRRHLKLIEGSPGVLCYANKWNHPVIIRNIPKMRIKCFLKLSEGFPGVLYCHPQWIQLKIKKKKTPWNHSSNLSACAGDIWHALSLHRLNGKGPAHTSAACSYTRFIYSADVRSDNQSRCQIGESLVCSNKWLFWVCIVSLPNLAIPLRGEMRPPPTTRHLRKVTLIAPFYIFKLVSHLCNRKRVKKKQNKRWPRFLSWIASILLPSCGRGGSAH